MMQAMTRHRALILSFVVAMLSGCSTSFWFTAVQGAAYERCESIKDADERSRCKSANEHLWQWDTRLPMWSSNEDEDPWAGGSKQFPAVGFEAKFKDNPQNLTSFRYPGNSHDPLVRPGEGQSLREWLNKQVSLPPLKGLNGFNYEDALPAIQRELLKKVN